MTAISDATTEPAPSNPWLQGTFAPVADERNDADLAVSGVLPAGLRGTFVRNGPNAMFPPITRYHLFDGDGMLHALTFDGEGSASYANRWIRSKGLEAEIEAGGALFGGHLGAPPPAARRRVRPGRAMKNTANTHVVRHAGRISCCSRRVLPPRSRADLGTIGEYDFGGALEGPMTAHPKIDPVTGEMVFFGASPFPPFLRVHSAAPDGTLTWSTEVELPASVMMHDFVITANQGRDLRSARRDGRPGAGCGRHRLLLGRGARSVDRVLERGAPGSTTRWIEVEPFWVFHFLNAHDVPGTDVIEVVGCRSSWLVNVFVRRERGRSLGAADPSPVAHRRRGRNRHR